MGFEEVNDLSTDNVIALGGFNRKTKKDNPTSIEGYYLGSRKVASPKSKTGFASIHVFQTPKGNVGVWGKTDMDRKMGSAIPGVMTKIVFDKMVPTPNGEMYKFKVLLDKENTIEVAELSAGSSDAGEDNSFESADTEADEEAETEEVDEDEAQEAALLAAQRKAKVEALLNKGKNKTK